jgi:hypothetical protein
MKPKYTGERGVNITEQQRKNIVKRLMAGEGATKICRETGISRGTIYNIKNKKGLNNIQQSKQTKYSDQDVNLLIEKKKLLKKKIKNDEKKQKQNKQKETQMIANNEIITNDVTGDSVIVSDKQLSVILDGIRKLPDDKIYAVLQSLAAKFQVSAVITDAAKVATIDIRQIIREAHGKKKFLRAYDYKTYLQSLNLASEIVHREESYVMNEGNVISCTRVLIEGESYKDDEIVEQ